MKKISTFFIYQSQVLSLFFTTTLFPLCLWGVLLFSLLSCSAGKIKGDEFPGTSDSSSTAPARPAVPGMDQQLPRPRMENLPLGNPPSLPLSKGFYENEKNFTKPHVGLVLGGAGVASFATVGILKKLFEEDLPIDFIITTGAPSVFALYYGYAPRAHDLEWFAMRLQERDLLSFESRPSPFLINSMKGQELSSTKIPIVFASSPPLFETSELIDKGNWADFLPTQLRFPGFNTPIPRITGAIKLDALHGLHLEEAVKRTNTVILAIHMYLDVAHSKECATRSHSDAQDWQKWMESLVTNLKKDMKLAHFAGGVELKKSPYDFSTKRAAISAGYKEAGKLLRAMRKGGKN